MMKHSLWVFIHFGIRIETAVIGLYALFYIH